MDPRRRQSSAALNDARQLPSQSLLGATPPIARVAQSSSTTRESLRYSTALKAPDNCATSRSPSWPREGLMPRRRRCSSMRRFTSGEWRCRRSSSGIRLRRRAPVPATGDRRVARIGFRRRAQAPATASGFPGPTCRTGNARATSMPRATASVAGIGIGCGQRYRLRSDERGAPRRSARSPARTCTSAAGVRASSAPLTFATSASNTSSTTRCV